MCACVLNVLLYPKKCSMRNCSWNECNEWPSGCHFIHYKQCTNFATAIPALCVYCVELVWHIADQLSMISWYHWQLLFSTCCQSVFIKKYILSSIFIRCMKWNLWCSTMQLRVMGRQNTHTLNNVHRLTFDSGEHLSEEDDILQPHDTLWYFHSYTQAFYLKF